MTYNIRLTKGAQNCINKLPSKVADAVLEFAYSALATEPHRVGKPLRDRWEGYYSARRSSYRIIYQIIDETVTVQIVKVAHRAQVYR